MKNKQDIFLHDLVLKNLNKRTPAAPIAVRRLLLGKVHESIYGLMASHVMFKVLQSCSDYE